MEVEDFVLVLPSPPPPHFPFLHFFSIIISQLLLRLGFTLLWLSLFSTGPCRPYLIMLYNSGVTLFFSGVNNYIPPTHTHTLVCYITITFHVLVQNYNILPRAVKPTG